MAMNKSRNKASFPDRITTKGTTPGTRPSYNVPGDGMNTTPAGTEQEMPNNAKRYGDAMQSAIGRGGIRIRKFERA